MRRGRREKERGERKNGNRSRIIRIPKEICGLAPIVAFLASASRRDVPQVWISEIMWFFFSCCINHRAYKSLGILSKLSCCSQWVCWQKHRADIVSDPPVTVPCRQVAGRGKSLLWPGASLGTCANVSWGDRRECLGACELWVRKHSPRCCQ